MCVDFLVDWTVDGVVEVVLDHALSGASLHRRGVCLHRGELLVHGGVAWVVALLHVSLGLRGISSVEELVDWSGI